MSYPTKMACKHILSHLSLPLGVNRRIYYTMLIYSSVKTHSKQSNVQVDGCGLTGQSRTSPTAPALRSRRPNLFGCNTSPVSCIDLDWDLQTYKTSLMYFKLTKLVSIFALFDTKILSRGLLVNTALSSYVQGKQKSVAHSGNIQAIWLYCPLNSFLGEEHVMTSWQTIAPSCTLNKAWFYNHISRFTGQRLTTLFYFRVSVEVVKQTCSNKFSSLVKN